MKITLRAPDGSELEVAGFTEFYRVVFTREDGEFVIVGARGENIEANSDHGIAVLPKASNMVELVPVDSARVLQGPRIEDRGTVARALEIAASNAEHGFNKSADAKVRLSEFAETIKRYAKALREG